MPHAVIRLLFLEVISVKGLAKEAVDLRGATGVHRDLSSSAGVAAGRARSGAKSISALGSRESALAGGFDRLIREAIDDPVDGPLVGFRGNATQWMELVLINA